MSPGTPRLSLGRVIAVVAGLRHRWDKTESVGDAVYRVVRELLPEVLVPDQRLLQAVSKAEICFVALTREAAEVLRIPVRPDGLYDLFHRGVVIEGQEVCQKVHQPFFPDDADTIQSDSFPQCLLKLHVLLSPNKCPFRGVRSGRSGGNCLSNNHVNIATNSAHTDARRQSSHARYMSCLILSHQGEAVKPRPEFQPVRTGKASEGAPLRRGFAALS